MLECQLMPPIRPMVLMPRSWRVRRPAGSPDLLAQAISQALTLRFIYLLILEVVSH
ncbi:hypothetical protein GCM10025862_34350 [Arsenicicoccus piscis]|uniref:Uncharacterized protein n=1 Tax=Arsenicicoccus piscis TaxID=673954 RepID=A0ABQ6HSG9_9MICO|nr:hypothetical protein GCM10025862_34350 [Arsenicicoccus piscis]